MQTNQVYENESFSTDEHDKEAHHPSGKDKDESTKDDGHSSEDNDPSERTFTVYSSRYYVLLIYSLILCLQATTWNTFGPISESMEFAYGWNQQDVATLANWGPICYTVAAIPTCYAIYRFGIRYVVIASTASVLLGHGLRCINDDPVVFKIMANICAVLNGVQGTLLLAGSMIPAVWFPAHQRVTATAFSAVLNQMGTSLSFLETLVVSQPSNETTVEEIKKDLESVIYFDLGVAAVLFICVVIYFPSAPPTPPTSSSEVPRFNVREGFQKILSSFQFWLLLVPLAVFTGVSMAWIGVITFSLEELGLSQDESGWLGFYCGISSVVICLIASRLADVFYGHLKIALLVLMCIGSTFFIWFMLLSLDVIPVTKAQIYITVLGGQGFNYATVPFFYELCIESVYPSPELGVGTLTTLSNNIVAMLFLFLFYIPAIANNDDATWMTYLLVGSNVLSIIPVLFTKEVYKRSKLDRKNL